MSETPHYVPMEHRLAYTLPQAASMTGLPINVIRQNVDTGSLPSFTLGSTVRHIRRTDLETWLASL